MDSRSEKVTSSGMWTLLKATSAPRGGASTTVDARKRKGRRSGTYVAVSPQRHEKRLQRDRGGEVQQAGERRGGLHDGVLAVRLEGERAHVDEARPLVEQSAHKHAAQRGIVARHAARSEDRRDQVRQARVLLHVHRQGVPLDGELPARGLFGGEILHDEREADLRLRLRKRHVERVEHGAHEGLLARHIDSESSTRWQC